MNLWNKQTATILYVFTLFILTVGVIARTITFLTEPSTTVLMFAISASTVLGYLIGNSMKGN